MKNMIRIQRGPEIITYGYESQSELEEYFNIPGLTDADEPELLRRVASKKASPYYKTRVTMAVNPSATHVDVTAELKIKHTSKKSESTEQLKSDRYTTVLEQLTEKLRETDTIVYSSLGKMVTVGGVNVFKPELEVDFEVLTKKDVAQIMDQEGYSLMIRNLVECTRKVEVDYYLPSITEYYQSVSTTYIW